MTRQMAFLRFLAVAVFGVLAVWYLAVMAR